MFSADLRMTDILFSAVDYMQLDDISNSFLCYAVALVVAVADYD